MDKTMKVFILTCVNEETEVVSTEVFATLEEAKMQMQKEYDSHVVEFAEEFDVESNFEGRVSYVKYGDCEYDWEITEAELSMFVVRPLFDKFFNGLITVRPGKGWLTRIFGEWAAYMECRFTESLEYFYNSLDFKYRETFIKYLINKEYYKK